MGRINVVQPAKILGILENIVRTNEQTVNQDGINPVRVYHPSYDLLDMLLDAKAAGSVNGTPAEPGPGGARLVHDVESKIAIAGGTENWTAQATPAYADQDRVYSQAPITRAFGVVVICKWRLTTDNPCYPLALVTSTTPIWNHTHVEAGFYRSAALSLAVIYNATLGPVVATIAVDTDYLLAIELRAAGAKWYIKGGAFTNWTKLFEHTLGSTATLYVASANQISVFALDDVRSPSRKFYDVPLASDSFARADGALGITDGLGHAEANGGGGLAWQFDAGAWAVSSNAAVGTPTQGAEIVLTPDFASDTNWTKDALWTISGGALHASAVAQFSKTTQASIFTIGNWYGYSFDVLNKVTGDVFFQEGANTTIRGTTGNATYVGSYRSIVGGQVNFKASAALGQFDIDNASVRLFTLSSLFSSLTLSTVNVMAECVIKTLVAGTQAGCVARLNSTTTPTSGIIAYWDGAGNVKVDEFTTATAWTNLLNVVKAYATGDKLVLWLNGSAWRLYHVTAAGVATLLGSGTTAVTTGNLFGNFSTYSGNAIESCNVYPVGAEGQWNGLDLF